MLGTAAVLNGSDLGPWIAYLGLAGVAYHFFGWFGTVINESEGGLYGAGVDRSFCRACPGSIFSEVMFLRRVLRCAVLRANCQCVARREGVSKFMTSLFAVGELRGGLAHQRPAAVGGRFETIPAFGLPAINTAILLTRA